MLHFEVVLPLRPFVRPLDMSLLVALSVVVAAQGATVPDSRYMQPAHYGAASAMPDTTAAGGFGESDNQPHLIRDTRLKGDGPKALLRMGRDQLVLTLGNQTARDVWFRAADGNLLGYLEAKDARGVFRPIQYHHAITCGNSRHRVGLKPGQGWSFDVALRPGSMKTVVRWRYRDQGLDLVSNEVSERISHLSFEIEPRLLGDHELWLDGDFPTLGWKRG